MATRRLSHLRFNLCAWLIMHALRLTRAHHKRNRAVEMGHGSQIVWLRSKEPQSSLVLVHIYARCSFARMGGGEDGHSRLFHLRFNLCAWLLVHALRLTRAHRKRNRSEMGYVSQLCGRGARSRNARSYSCTFYARGLCLVDKKVNTSCYDMLCRIVSHFCRAEQSKSRLADNLRDVRLTCGMRRWPR